MESHGSASTLPRTTTTNTLQQRRREKSPCDSREIPHAVPRLVGLTGGRGGGVRNDIENHGTHAPMSFRPEPQTAFLDAIPHDRRREESPMPNSADFALHTRMRHGFRLADSRLKVARHLANGRPRCYNQAPLICQSRLSELFVGVL